MLDGVATGLRQGEDAAGALTPYIFEGGRDWPAIRLRTEAPLDWRAASALTVPIENRAAAPFDLLLRLDDSPAANGDDRSLSGRVTIPPHAAGVVVMPLAPTPAGMRGRPTAPVTPQPGDLPVSGLSGTVDVRHIVALHLSGVHPQVSQTLLIGAPALRARAGPATGVTDALADRYGQALGGDWPEKVGDDEALRRHLAAAIAQTRRLAADQAPWADRFGGLSRPTLPASGFFRVARIGDRWSLVTPAGHPMLSLGVDAVQSSNPTLVTGRETLMRDHPAPGSPLAAFYADTPQGRVFDIGGADLARGLGPDWRHIWSKETIARLQAWGFNTLGTWSEESLGSALPFVLFTDVEGHSAMVPMGGRALVDPFDPRFAVVADAVAARMTEGHRSDPNLIGYFSGNELPWGEDSAAAEGLTAHVLALSPDGPARQTLLADLRARYRTPDAWAAAWGLAPRGTWDAPVAWPDTPTAAARADSERFETHFAERYFSTVADALKRHDPNHLYLGTRFAAATPAIVRACARFCDVMSFNVYGRTPAARAALWRGLDRPVLIGEFHFGSLDRGSFWPGMVAVGREADRGPAYAAYLAAAVEDPAVVGVHWYQYADEPLTGRPYDGENGHIGLVAVTDVPYAGFVTAVAAANRAAQARFAQQLAP